MPTRFVRPIPSTVPFAPKGLPPIARSKNLDKWYIFPDALTSGRFTGYQTRDNPSQNRGAFVVGQNTMMSLAQTPTPRYGYEVIGTEQENATPVTRAWTFETRGGQMFELKAYDTGVYYYLWGVSTDYSLLLGGFTPNLEFGYGNIGKSSNPTTSCFFSNGTDGVYEFNGAFATLASATATTLTIASGTWTALGFYTAGVTRSIIINGITATYSGGEGTTTLTGVSVDFSATPAGTLVVQVPREQEGTAPTNNLSAIQGHIMMAHDGRLHMNFDAKADVWQYSKLDDPFDFTTGSSDGDGGAKEIEFGGPIVAFGKLNQMAIAFKNRMVKTLQFIQVGERVDSPKYDTLVSVDDKGTTLGAINQKSTFSTPLGLVFTTPDKRLCILTGITANSQPQYLFLSDPIQQVMQAGVHDTATGICLDNEIWYSFKSTPSSTFNDVEIHGNMLRQTLDNYGRALPIQWDTPTVGKQVADYTIVYRQDLGRNELHWHSAVNSNSYRVIPDKVDNTNSFTSIVRTWEETFGAPERQKRIDYCFVEIQMLPNTIVQATLLYDENGATGQPTYILNGNMTSNQFGATPFNPFGSSPYGWEQIGSNGATGQLVVYRFWLEIDPNIPFFNISLQLSGDTQNNDFNLSRFGYRLAEVIEDVNRTIKIGINS